MKTHLPAFESLDQIAGATAANLSQAAAASAYELFCDKEFRRMAGLEQLSQVEQDRIFNEMDSAEKSLDLDGLSRIQLLVPVQAVSIGCHHHVCRGETDGKDGLFKQILKSSSKFYAEL